MQQHNCAQQLTRVQHYPYVQFRLISVWHPADIFCGTTYGAHLPIALRRPALPLLRSALPAIYGADDCASSKRSLESNIWCLQQATCG